MMPSVIRRNVDQIYVFNAVCKFYSRIILKKLSPIKLLKIRKVEKDLKNLIIGEVGSTLWEISS